MAVRYACSPLGCVAACVVYGRFDSRFDSNEKNDSQVITYNTKTYVFSMDVAHFWGTFFRPYISVHFCNLFVSHIALPVKSDIKKPCKQHMEVRCPWNYKSNNRKCLLLLIGRFRIGHATFRWFPKMYFRFPRHHVNISGRDVTELYMAINSPQSPWQRLKSAWPYLLQFWRYIGKTAKVDWTGGIYPPPPHIAAGISVKKTSYVGEFLEAIRRQL